MNYESNTPIKLQFSGGKINEISHKKATKKPKKSANFAKTMGFKATHEYN